MLLADWLGIVAGSLTTMAFVPQVLKTWKSRSTEDISATMFIIFSLGVTLWITYGVAIRSIPIIIANSITLVLAGVILYFKLRRL